METDIGNPIEYDPINDPFKNDEKNEDSTPIQQEQPYYFQPSEMMYPQHQFYPPQEKPDFLSGIEKTTWIVAFAVFLLGFFMGKTMQPVILRYAWVSCKVTNIPIYWDNLPCDVTIYKLSWIYRYDKRITSIFDKSIGCTHFNFFTFVFWKYPSTWFKKQNKERTCQNDG